MFTTIYVFVRDKYPSILDYIFTYEDKQIENLAPVAKSVVCHSTM